MQNFGNAAPTPIIAPVATEPASLDTNLAPRAEKLITRPLPTQQWQAKAPQYRNNGNNKNGKPNVGNETNFGYTLQERADRIDDFFENRIKTGQFQRESLSRMSQDIAYMESIIQKSRKSEEDKQKMIDTLQKILEDKRAEKSEEIDNGIKYFNEVYLSGDMINNKIAKRATFYHLRADLGKIDLLLSKSNKDLMQTLFDNSKEVIAKLSAVRDLIQIELNNKSKRLESKQIEEEFETSLRNLELSVFRGNYTSMEDVANQCKNLLQIAQDKKLIEIYSKKYKNGKSITPEQKVVDLTERIKNYFSRNRIDTENGDFLEAEYRDVSGEPIALGDNRSPEEKAFRDRYDNVIKFSNDITNGKVLGTVDLQKYASEVFHVLNQIESMPASKNKEDTDYELRKVIGEAINILPKETKIIVTAPAGSVYAGQKGTVEIWELLEVIKDGYVIE